MSDRTDSVIKGLNLLAAHHDRPYSDWGNKAATAAIAEIDLLSEEIARLREERLTVDEREALELSLELQWPATSEQWKAFAACLGPVCVAPANKHKVAIRELLDRQPLPPGPEPKEVGRG